MSLSFSSHKIALFSSLICLPATFIVLFSSLPLFSKLLVFLVIALFWLSAFDFRLGFLAIIFLRPVIDLSVNNILFSIGSLSVNVLSLLGALLIALAILFILSGKASLPASRSTILLYAWIFFIFLGSLTLFNSFYLSESLKELLRFLSILSAFFFGASLLRTAKDLTTLIKVIIFSALPPAILALFQLINKTGLPDGEIYRVFGSMTHPNMLAFYLLLAITLAVFLLLNLRRTRLEVYIYSFFALFYIFILFFTYTRGAYLALLMVFIIIGVAKFKKFLLFSIIILLFAYALMPPLQSRFNSIFQSDPYGSVSWRFNLWRDGFSYFQERPWSGYGLGTAEKVIATKRDFRLGSPDPHNDYLRIALDGGYPLLAAYLLLLASFFWVVLKAYLQEKRPRLKSFFLFFLAFGLAIFAMSGGDNILNDTALQWQMWALTGSALASTHLKKDLSD